MQTDLATIQYRGRTLTVEAIEMHGGAIVCGVTEGGVEVVIPTEEHAALEALFVEARALKAANDAVTMRDADERNTARKVRGEAKVVHSRSAPRRCRPGRAW